MTEIKDGKRIITSPVTDEDLRDLKIGDTFYVSGTMVTSRDSAHKRFLTDGESFPVDMNGGILFHAGPIVQTDRAGCKSVVSIGPTTSMRMEQFEYDFIKATGVRIIIGKGGMGDRTAAACREFGAIHCVFPGGCAVLGASAVEEIKAEHWADLGMAEAAWELRVKEFGPLVVSIDTSGRNYFTEKERRCSSAVHSETPP